ncbi:hypothetical protein PSN13_06535 [Micromonospora saelicesensis]|uniref:Uncharacterized protein n=1 Tax=Micromonospora saelicesensis TaxID=285676 RepID=A0A328NC51_9ACTN|nr:hypothetical protein [Micromonospora saelicesensis]RAO26507.1 hypothetical protein PSN13_06535 [Micromonospora saelicesensis]
MTRLRMALDAITAAITAPFTRPDTCCDYEALAEAICARAARTNGDKP